MSTGLAAETTRGKRIMASSEVWYSNMPDVVPNDDGAHGIAERGVDGVRQPETQRCAKMG